MDCLKRDSLIAHYETANRVFIEAVREVSTRGADADLDTYQQLEKLAETARARCEQARTEFTAHVAEHGCLKLSAEMQDAKRMPSEIISPPTERASDGPS